MADTQNNEQKVVKMERVNLEMSYEEAKSLIDLLETHCTMRLVKNTVNSFNHQLETQAIAFAKENGLIPDGSIVEVA